jgi:hypothetical protein
MPATADELITHMSMISDAMLVRDMHKRPAPAAYDRGGRPLYNPGANMDNPVFWFAAASDADRELINQYVALRKASPEFNPRSWEGGCPDTCDGDPHRVSCQAKSHRAIAAEWQRVRAAARNIAVIKPDVVIELTCVVCGRSFTAKRADAKTCRPRCRKTLSRRSNVTDSDENPQVRA